MQQIKDNFSAQSDLYAKYRPEYPAELYAFLFSLVPGNKVAWDCATGNGQVAVALAQHFEQVFATDISDKQLANARVKENVVYRLERVEASSFPENYFDLITVAQAVHWFDFDLFYKEVFRTSKKSGIIAVFGYGLFQSSEAINKITTDFYTNIVGPYWDEERKYIDEAYQTIPFPFKEVNVPPFFIRCTWRLDDLLGYLSTWSAVQHYKKALNEDPVEHIKKELIKVWPPGSFQYFEFPVLLKVAAVNSYLK